NFCFRPPTASSAARIQCAGSCSDQPGCGRETSSEPLAEPTIRWSPSISIALTPDVPRSRPRYMTLLLAPSGQVVLQKNIDADSLLRGQHRQSVRLRLQHPDGTAYLVAGVLVEDRVNRAVDKRLPGRAGEFMGDNHRPPFRVNLAKCPDQAAIAGAEAVDAVQADMPAKRLTNGCFGQPRIVPRLDYRQDRHLREILRQDRQETFQPFAMVAHQHGTGEHPDAAVHLAEEAPHE